MTIPDASESANTIQSDTTPVNTIVARAKEMIAELLWVSVRILRLSYRSARTPPHGPRNRTGPNASAALIPSAVPLLVSVSTSHEVAVKVIHVPTADTNCPLRNRRKFRETRAASEMRRQVTRMRDLNGRL